MLCVLFNNYVIFIIVVITIIIIIVLIVINIFDIILVKVSITAAANIIISDIIFESS